MTPWDVLELSETDDVRSIKRAYSRALRNARPETDPAAFQQLTDAYEWALGYARHQQRQREAGPASETQAPENNATPPLLVGQQGETVAPAVEASGGDAMPADVTLDDAPAAAEPQPGFAFGPFFEGIVEQIRKDDPKHLKQWLESHPDLYSIELKWALIPHVFDALAHNAAELNPHRGHLDTLQGFFGIDASLRRHPAVAPAMDYLEAQPWKSPQATPDQALPSGWENLGEVMDKRRPQRRNDHGSGIPIWPIIFGLMMLARLLSSISSGS